MDATTGALDAMLATLSAENPETLAGMMPDAAADLGRLRKRFRLAVEAASDWHDEAIEDYRFWAGKQWDEQDKKALVDRKRPAITINRIRPLINLFSGYQILNRYDPEFLPRTPDDLELAKVRKAVTKFILDETDFGEVESECFFHAIVSGISWAEVSVEPEEDGASFIRVQRRSGFDIYPDPLFWKKYKMERVRFLFSAVWTTAEELKAIYPELAGEIDALSARAESEEEFGELAGGEALWYQAEERLIRLVTAWELEYTDYPRQRCSYTVFAGDVVLESGESPYLHGQIPFVPLLGYVMGEGDADDGNLPAGVVRDLRDPQREINKRRSQWLDVVNRQTNSGWVYSRAALDYDGVKKLEQMGSAPGVMVAYEGPSEPHQIPPPPVPQNLVAIEEKSKEDLQQISGINEAMLGQDVPASSSGRAIELRQRQAVTQVAYLFEQLRRWKREVLYLLWGKRGKPGTVQQYLREPMMVRITAPNGEMAFLPVNQQVPLVDPATGAPLIDPMTLQAVTRTVNDLSVGRFDIVISETPATATQRVAQYYALIEAAQAGIQIPPDVLLEASDLPQKEEIKQRMLQEQMMRQRQMEMEEARRRGMSGAPPGEMGGPMGPQEQIRQQVPVM